MQVVRSEMIVACDIDDTLVLWQDNFTQPHEGAIGILDPYDQSINYLVPHQKHIDLLKKYKGRGFYIKVWSAAGYKWAESVVKALGLESIVDSVETKPTKYIDDLNCAEWLGPRIYLENK